MVLPFVLAVTLGACRSSDTTDSGSSVDSEPPPAKVVHDPGFMPIHRLNNLEYANTLRDLLQTDHVLGVSFPPDPVDHGFDNVAELLTVSPLLVEVYEAAATEILADFFADDPEVGRSAGYLALVAPCDEATAGEAVCAEQVLGAFTARAWRRPVTHDELDWVLAVYAEAAKLGLGYDASLEAAMKAVLLAPEFVFRVEADAVGGPRYLDGYELASRLSYFLWSSMPDEALFAAAADGSLLAEDGLQAQVVRMLADEKADALVASFASQWLGARAVDQLAPVAALYPGFDESLRRSMKEEILRDAADAVLGGAPIDRLFTADRSWIDARLAEHYAVPFDPADGEWQSTSLLPARRGVLGTAGWLAAHSHGERPSVVLRGKWVLEELLCQEVPPPPPGVTTDVVIVDDAGSVREQEEAARQTPESTCGDCHGQMDPYGHALGNFDAIGAERAVDELGFPIDTVVTLPTGEEVESILGALDLLVADPRFAQCVAEKAFRYGIGRSLRVEDAPYVEAYTDALVTNDLVFEAVVSSIVRSDPFRMKGPLPE